MSQGYIELSLIMVELLWIPAFIVSFIICMIAKHISDEREYKKFMKGDYEETTNH